MHIKSFYAQQHCYVSQTTLCPGGIRTRVCLCYDFVKKLAPAAWSSCITAACREVIVGREIDSRKVCNREVALCKGKKSAIKKNIFRPSLACLVGYIWPFCNRVRNIQKAKKQQNWPKVDSVHLILQTSTDHPPYEISKSQGPPLQRRTEKNS
jgi:hypothetical protein